MNIQKIWKNIRKPIEKEISPINYGLWIQPLKPLKLEEEKLVLTSPNSYTSTFFEDRYKKLVENLVSKIAGKKIHIEIKET
ncbi:MAG: hypothetical protein PF689_06910, partial [Deltaproteobacteria bacterium]|nr:hypothetical protein [Deltaproteobacteria bacterium]